jgi:hypothetical protein
MSMPVNMCHVDVHRLCSKLTIERSNGQGVLEAAFGRS